MPSVSISCLGRNVRRHNPGHDSESVRSSDGESGKHETEELQRARAHLKETLEGKIEKLKKVEAEKHQNQSETKVVVHRSENQHIPPGKTLDSEAIKQYQNIKQNTAALGNKQQRYSGVFLENQKMAIKDRQPGSREHQKIYKQSSFDSLSRNSEPTTTIHRHEGTKKRKNVNCKMRRLKMQIHIHYFSI